MSKEYHMKPLKELNLTDRFLFAQVMEDTGTQEDVLSIVLGKENTVTPSAQDVRKHRSVRWQTALSVFF